MDSEQKAYTRFLWKHLGRIFVEGTKDYYMVETEDMLYLMKGRKFPKQYVLDYYEVGVNI